AAAADRRDAAGALRPLGDRRHAGRPDVDQPGVHLSAAGNQGHGPRSGAGGGGRLAQLACRSSLSAMPWPSRATTSTAPVSELRRNSRLLAPESSRALTVLPSGVVTLVPAVTYRPASMTQSSPSEMPSPALAPSRQRLPIEMTWVPPPDSVPMIDAPPPTSEPSSTTTPAEIRPSTIELPNVPALKFTKPSCMTVVPEARCAPSRTRSASAMRTPGGTT